MTDSSLELIYQQLENTWHHSGAWSEYIRAMRMGVLGKVQRADPEKDPARWSLLPGLCCQAAGGDPGWADEVTRAWFLFYAAAQLFDNLEDHDPLEASWPSQGVALNAATGLLFSAALALNSISSRSETQTVAAQVCTEFYKALLIMGSGQHCDLVKSQLTLEEWLNIAAAKSGSFFGLACLSGAMLVTDDSRRLDGFRDFGRHLGIVIQILDDLGDLRASDSTGKPIFSAELRKSLAVAYVMEVGSNPVKERLGLCLEAATKDPVVAVDVLQLLKENGTELYLLAEIERQRGLALVCLEKAKPEPLAGKQLVALLQELDV